MKKYISCFLLFNIYIKSNSLIVDIDNNEWLPFVGDVSNKFYKYLNVSATFSGEFPFYGDLVFSLGVKKSFCYNMLTIGLQNHVGGIKTDGNAMILPSMLPRVFVKILYFSDMLNSNINFKYSCLYNYEKKDFIHSLQLYLNFDEFNISFGGRKDTENKLYKIVSQSFNKNFGLKKELIALASKENSGFQEHHMRQLCASLEAPDSKKLDICTGTRILLSGQSGSGKTYICSNICDILKKYKHNAFSFDFFGMNAGGYHGKTLDNAFETFYDNCVDKFRFEYSVIVIDEVDKLGGSDVPLRMELLNNLLTLLNSNGTITVKRVTYSLKKMSFIFPASFSSVINYDDGQYILSTNLRTSVQLQEASIFLYKIKEHLNDTSINKPIDNLLFSLDVRYRYSFFIDLKKNLNQIIDNYSKIFYFIEDVYNKNKQQEHIDNIYIENLYSQFMIKYPKDPNEAEKVSNSLNIIIRLYLGVKNLKSLENQAVIKNSKILQPDFLNRVTFVEMELAKVQLKSILINFEILAEAMKKNYNENMDVQLNKKLLKIFIIADDFADGRIFEKMVKNLSSRLSMNQNSKILHIFSPHKDDPGVIPVFDFRYLNLSEEKAMNLFLDHIDLFSTKDENILSEFINKQQKISKLIEMKSHIIKARENSSKNIVKLINEFQLSGHNDLLFKPLNFNDVHDKTIDEILELLCLNDLIIKNHNENDKIKFMEKLKIEVKAEINSMSFCVLRDMYMNDVNEKITKYSKDILTIFETIRNFENSNSKNIKEKDNINNAKQNITIEKCAEFITAFNPKFQVISSEDELKALILSSKNAKSEVS